MIFALLGFLSHFNHRVEEECLENSPPLPRYSSLSFLCNEHSHLGCNVIFGIPLGTVLPLSILWFGVSVFLGGYFGNRKTAIEAPVETCTAMVPQTHVFYTNGRHTAYFRLYQFSLSFGSSRPTYGEPVVFHGRIPLSNHCCLDDIVRGVQLCSEDYKWWWRAFLNGGSSIFYLFVCLVFYVFAKWEIIMRVCGIWYTGYIFIVLCAFFVVTGSVGFYACLWFVRIIYSSVKIE
ncbi:transmembrane 9 superfamily member 7-like [Salvia hispanica]|uniref:transmembrane 9 superfamily member 7-like n=1 Tax=Salvia hispanica TaxID=49212 RepID=UPI0020099992|nr:transmembrane 9 superfamily member 7-like [Salvia hispanica]